MNPFEILETRSRRPTITNMFNQHEYGLEPHRRQKYIKKHLIWGLLELLFTLILGYVIIDEQETSWGFIDKLHQFELRWIYVYFAIQILYLVRRLVFILQWKFHEDPREKQACLHFVTFIILNTAEFIMMIIGNCRIFYASDGFIKSPNLFYCLLVIIIYGYIVMILYVFSLFVILFLYCGFKQYGMFDEDAQNAYSNKIR